jgi:hypothetical protein
MLATALPAGQTVSREMVAALAVTVPGYLPWTGSPRVGKQGGGAGGAADRGRAGETRGRADRGRAGGARRGALGGRVRRGRGRGCLRGGDAGRGGVRRCRDAGGRTGRGSAVSPWMPLWARSRGSRWVPGAGGRGCVRWGGAAPPAATLRDGGSPRPPGSGDSVESTRRPVRARPGRRRCMHRAGGSRCLPRAPRSRGRTPGATSEEHEASWQERARTGRLRKSPSRPPSPLLSLMPSMSRKVLKIPDAAAAVDA